MCHVLRKRMNCVFNSVKVNFIGGCNCARRFMDDNYYCYHMLCVCTRWKCWKRYNLICYAINHISRRINTCLYPSDFVFKVVIVFTYNRLLTLYQEMVWCIKKHITMTLVTSIGIVARQLKTILDDYLCSSYVLKNVYGLAQRST